MKLHSIRQIGAVLTLPALLLAAGCSSTPHHGADAGLATVTKITGGARVSIDSATWQPLHKGSHLNPGAVVQTAVGATVEFDAGEVREEDSGGSKHPSAPAQRNRVTLAPDTSVKIVALPPFGVYTGDNDIRLQLLTGGVMCVGEPTAESPLCEIGFAYGSVRARGAAVLVQADGIVRVLRGSASWARANGSGRAIAQGHQFDARTGKITKIGSNAKVEVTSPPAGRGPTPPPVESGPPLRK